MRIIVFTYDTNDANGGMSDCIGDKKGCRIFPSVQSVIDHLEKVTVWGHDFVELFDLDTAKDICSLVITYDAEKKVAYRVAGNTENH